MTTLREAHQLRLQEARRNASHPYVRYMTAKYEVDALTALSKLESLTPEQTDRLMHAMNRMDDWSVDTRP